MLFIRDKFNENVDYCEYIYNVCSKYFLQYSFADIQDIANNYVFELDSMGIDTENELVKDEELLFKVIEELFDCNSNKELDEDELEMEYEIKNVLCDLRLQREKLVNSFGGYGYEDAYDDISIEDKNNNLTLKYTDK